MVGGKKIEGKVWGGRKGGKLRFWLRLASSPYTCRNEIEPEVQRKRKRIWEARRGGRKPRVAERTFPAYEESKQCLDAEHVEEITLKALGG